LIGATGSPDLMGRGALGGGDQRPMDRRKPQSAV